MPILVLSRLRNLGTVSRECSVEIKLLFNLLVWAPCGGDCLPGQICNSSSPNTTVPEKAPEGIITGCYPNKVPNFIRGEMASRLPWLTAPVRTATQSGQEGNMTRYSWWTQASGPICRVTQRTLLLGLWKGGISLEIFSSLPLLL